jgi:uncharacterized protein YjbJ (UPF0337 family)
VISQSEISGAWNDLKGRIKEEWGVLTEDDLKSAEGHVDRLVGLIQRKTGQAKRQIEDTLQQLLSEPDSVVKRATASTRHVADQTLGAVRDVAEWAREAAEGGYAEAEDFVRSRPTESVLVALGTGLVVGVVIGLVVRSR